MGAQNISDADLMKLCIEIIQDEDPETRKLIIPVESIKDYKKLIRSKLDDGYWNEFVGDDQIYFIFKMPDGEIIEYEYCEDDKIEIAKLCTQLNKDPIEKNERVVGLSG